MDQIGDCHMFAPGTVVLRQMIKIGLRKGTVMIN